MEAYNPNANNKKVSKDKKMQQSMRSASSVKRAINKNSEQKSARGGSASISGRQQQSAAATGQNQAAQTIVCKFEELKGEFIVKREIGRGKFSVGSKFNVHLSFARQLPLVSLIMECFDIFVLYCRFVWSGVQGNEM